MRTIAIANQKGGVGKTTTAVNLAVSLAIAEREVLLIDLDPQGNATSGLGIPRNSLGKNTYSLFGQEAEPLSKIALPTGVPRLALIPSTIDLVGVEIELAGVEGRERVLARRLAEADGAYDYLILDCPPSLGLLTLNGLVAATRLLIPLQCEYYAMEGLSQLLETVARVQRSLNPLLAIEGILLTMVDARNNLSQQVADEVRRHFPFVFKTAIPRNVALAEAPSHGKPALLYDAVSRGAQAYLSLAKEVLSHEATGAR